MTAPEFCVKFEMMFCQAELTEEADSDILVHWLELNLSRRLVGKVYGVSLMPETYAEWKALVERLDAQQCCFDGVITQQNSVCLAPPTTNRPPFPQTRFTPAALPRTLASAPRPFLAQPLAHTPAPPSMPCPTNAGDAMVVDRARAPGVVRTCFQCGQAGHMVRECPLPDTHPQIPRL